MCLYVTHIRNRNVSGGFGFSLDLHRLHKNETYAVEVLACCDGCDAFFLQLNINWKSKKLLFRYIAKWKDRIMPLSAVYYSKFGFSGEWGKRFSANFNFSLSRKSNKFICIAVVSMRNSYGWRMNSLHRPISCVCEYSTDVI